MIYPHLSSECINCDHMLSSVIKSHQVWLLIFKCDCCIVNNTPTSSVNTNYHLHVFNMLFLKCYHLVLICFRFSQHLSFPWGRNLKPILSRTPLIQDPQYIWWLKVVTVNMRARSLWGKLCQLIFHFTGRGLTVQQIEDASWQLITPHRWSSQVFKL